MSKRIRRTPKKEVQKEERKTVEEWYQTLYGNMKISVTPSKATPSKSCLSSSKAPRAATPAKSPVGKTKGITFGAIEAVSFARGGKVGELMDIGDGGYSMNEVKTTEDNERTRQNGLLLDEWSDSLTDFEDVGGRGNKKRRESSVFKPPSPVSQEDNNSDESDDMEVDENVYSSSPSHELPHSSYTNDHLVRNSHNLLSNLLNFTVVINDDGILLTFSDLADMGAAFKVRYEMVGEDKCKMVDYGLVKYKQDSGGEEVDDDDDDVDNSDQDSNHDQVLYDVHKGAEEEYELRRILEECGKSNRWRPHENEVIEPHELNQHYERGSRYFSSLATLLRSLSTFSLSHPYKFTAHPLVVDDAEPPVCDYLIVDVKKRGGKEGEEAILKIGIACSDEVKVDTIFRDGKEVQDVVKGNRTERILEMALGCAPQSPER
ncbi:hypothetical protein TrRE_jg9938 [Triparma retinervis]|uniref:Uncharacterized protein n=1 Tax=Triparma retinervis TaxID=2557542 RepID=A0A9W7L681_9STRA|nr:hypothetical protein TrRE_jg9938 [Triparma retinervis]